MCRFMVYQGRLCLLADLVTKPSRSLTRQSYDARYRVTDRGYLNGDGFGIGWYPPEDQSYGNSKPCMFSSIQPAWNNQNLERLANQIVSPLIFAHVRAALPGIPVNESNCQPFVCGRYMWMHNGGVGGFLKIRRKLLDCLRDDVYDKCPSFESDSAICFALFLNLIDDPMKEMTPDELVAKMEAVINQINQVCIDGGVGDEESLLNFVISDGRTVVATRYCNLPGVQQASLFYASGSRFECADAASNDYFVKHADRRGLLGIVASEPLTDESSDWIQVPPNTMVVMTRYKGQFVDLILVPINAPPTVARDISRSFKALASCTATSQHVSLSLASSHSSPFSSSTAPLPLLENPISIATASVSSDISRPPCSAIEPPSTSSSPCCFAHSSRYVPPPPGIPITKSPRHTMTGHNHPALALAVDGHRVFTGSEDGFIKQFDLETFRCVHSFCAHSQTIFALAIHGQQLFSSSTRVVKIWDKTSFQLLTSLRYSDGDVFGLALALGRAVAGPAGTSIIRCHRGLAGPGSRKKKPQPTGILEEEEEKDVFYAAPSEEPLGRAPNYAVGREDGPTSGGMRVVTGFAAPQANGSSRVVPRVPSDESLVLEYESKALSSSIAQGDVAGVHNGEVRRSSSSSGLAMLLNGDGRNVVPEAMTEEAPTAATTMADAGAAGTLLAADEGGISESRASGTSSSGSIGTCDGGQHVSSSGRHGSYIAGYDGAEEDELLGANGVPDVMMSSVPTGGFVYPSQKVGLEGGGGAVQTNPRTALNGTTAASAAAPVKVASSPSLLRPRSTCRQTEAQLALTNTEQGGHCSRVYAMVVCHPFLCSGAGDAFVKVWNLHTSQPVATLHGHKGGVMALASVKEPGKDSQWLLSGSRDNTIRVWDLSTSSCVTTITGHCNDVLALAVGKDDDDVFYSASTDHTIRMWCLRTFDCLRIFVHEGSSFLSIACTATGVVSGSSDGIIRVWDVETPRRLLTRPNFKLRDRASEEEGDLMEATLRQLVAMRAVSGSDSQLGRDQAWQAAKLLMGLLDDLGAETQLIAPDEGCNPVVFGRIMQDPRRLTVTICGHYDVSDASQSEGWSTPPFELVSIDGWLHGRGVSSSKGPLIATLFAIRDLVKSGQLKVNVVFVIDGMTESRRYDSVKDAVLANLDWFEGTGLILTSSGSWMTDTAPCLIYGTRGHICLVVEVSGPAKDLHTGHHGGTFNEPLNDLITVLSNLVDSNNMILIPGFYDDVKAPDEREEQLYSDLHFRIEDYKAMNGLKAVAGSTSKELLENRWRNPSLSIVHVESSPGSWSLVPKKCSAQVVIRHVPDQNPNRLIERFKAHVEHEFAKLRSRGNSVSVSLHSVGDWWLADPSSDYYQVAERVIEKQWGISPMYIREGGTYPVVPFLQEALGAPAILIPISQATDHCAVANEKLRWTNFKRGKEVIKEFLQIMGED